MWGKIRERNEIFETLILIGKKIWNVTKFQEWQGGKILKILNARKKNWAARHRRGKWRKNSWKVKYSNCLKKFQEVRKSGGEGTRKFKMPRKNQERLEKFFIARKSRRK